jgi:hypothetical protein
MRLSIFVLSLALGCGTGCGSEGSGDSGAGGDGSGGAAATGGTTVGGNGGTSGASPTGGTGATSSEECATARPPGAGEFTDALLMRNDAPVFRDLDAACDGSALFVGTIHGAVQIVDSSGLETDVSETLDVDEAWPLFLTRIGANGSVLWNRVVRWGLTTSRVGPYVSAFMDGASAVAGSFGMFTRFAVGEPNETEIIGGRVGFVARYDANGDFQWVRTIGTEDTFVRAVAAGFDGSTHITAFMAFPGVLAPGELDLEIEGPNHVAIATLDASGRFVRAIRMLGVDDDGATLRAMPDGQLAVIGDFDGSAVIGDDGPNPVTLSASGTAVADVRLTNSLSVASARALPLSIASRFSPVSDGSLLAAGIFFEMLTLGVGEPNETTLTNADQEGTDGFVVRVGADALVGWVVQLAGMQGLSITTLEMASLPDGSTWLGARTQTSDSRPASVVIGFGSPTATTVFLTEGEDTVVARLSRDGRVEWAAPIVSDGVAMVDGVAPTPNSVWVAGTFTGTVSLGAEAATPFDAATDPESFLVRFGP